MIDFKNVYLAYNKEYYALFDLSMQIKKGDRVAIIGEKGSGKTAILRIIAGLENFQRGEVTINDMSVKKIDFANDISLGFISSKALFYENKTVEANFEWILKSRNIPKENWQSLINKTLAEYEISHLKKARVSTLCRSDRRLLQIARLALRPIDILLCDEFDTDIDPATKEVLNKALTKLINTDPKDKIVICAYDKSSQCDDFITRKLYMNLGSVKE